MPDESLNFDEQILEAARSIAAATAALVKAASAAQRELVAQGRVRMYMQHTTLRSAGKEKLEKLKLSGFLSALVLMSDLFACVFSLVWEQVHAVQLVTWKMKTSGPWDSFLL